MRRLTVMLLVLGGVRMAGAAYDCPAHPVCGGTLSDTNLPCYAVSWTDYAAGDSEAGYCIFKPAALGVPQQYPAQGAWFSATVTRLPNGHWELALTNQRSSKVGAVKFPYIIDETGWNASCANTPPQDLDFKLGTDHRDDIILEPHILGQAVKQTERSWWQWSTYSYGGRRAFVWDNGPGNPPGDVINAAGAFSPLLIRTDPQQAELLAATNWDTSLNPDLEPSNAWPTWACNGWFLWYPIVEINTGQTSRFRFMLTASNGAPGIAPWVAVALDYQNWFRPLYDAWRQKIGGGVVDYPGWMKDAHGFLNMGLMNFMDTQLTNQVVTWRWTPFRTTLPWAMFWGEMSDYGGTVANGGCGNPGPISACGCCGQCRRLHPRYDNIVDSSCPGFDLVSVITGMVGDGGRAGVYTSPRCEAQSGQDACSLELSTPLVADRDDCTDPTGPCPTTSPTDFLTPLAWFKNWEARSRTDWHANAVYYDTLGGVYYGAPLFMANLFKNGELSMESIIEWTVDVNPAASLSGGSLLLPDGTVSYRRLEDIWGGAANTVAFAELGTFLQNDRMFFNGYSDGGPSVTGICHDYWAERQTFLLGHKFDVGVPFEQVDGATTACASELDDATRAEIVTHCSGDWAVGPTQGQPPTVWADQAHTIPCLNLALKLSIQLRSAHNWLNRPMRYQHRKGLTNVANGVDIRSFSDGAARVLVVDNWHNAGGRFCLDGTVYPVPGAKLAILEGADLADSDGDHIGDSLEGQIVATGDPDADGLITSCDNCPNTANANQTDGDGDGLGDLCDVCPLDTLNDQDGDGICAGSAFAAPKVGKNDNCVAVANASQANSDGDALGDACDSCSLDALNDQDGDGICAGNAFSAPKVGKNDNCVSVANADQANADADALGDACDPCALDALNDQDGDGICAGDAFLAPKVGKNDNCVTIANPTQTNSDGDTFGDACDNCATVTNQDQADWDADGVGDACEIVPVDASFFISTMEVTNAEYALFLNAVAATDTNALYNTNMGSNIRGGITRSGASGAYTYTARTNMGNKPVNYVSWYDAARYCNWLHNGRPTGAQGIATTERGAYNMSLTTNTIRVAGARWFLPTSTEWARAAYHQNPSTEWTYPTKSNATPVLATATATGSIGNPGANVANYNNGADWNGQNGNVTTVGSGGAASASAYGTFDQGGNVVEWTEGPTGSKRIARGGSYASNASTLASSSAPTVSLTTEAATNGFRVAKSTAP